MEASTIHQLLALQAACRPEAPALLGGQRAALNYRQLESQTRELGRQLRSLGIAGGDRVAIVLPNGPEMAAAFLAVASVATAAPLNPAYRRAEFDFYLSDLRAEALLTLEGMESAATAAAATQGAKIIFLRIDPSAPAGTLQLASPPSSTEQIIDLPAPGDTALILHTSGTTARPKIVPLTQANLCASARNVCASLDLRPADCCLNVMPLFHIHGLVAALLASLWAGGSVACTEGFVVTRFLQWLRQYGATWYTAVPTMHQSIVARAQGEGASLGAVKLRLVRSSSSALAPQVGAEIERIFGVPMIEAYGMTEAAHQMCANPLPPGKRRPGSVGLPAGPEVAVMNQEGELLGAQKTGEVVIRGPNVMAGYENNPQANQAAFTNGWLRTGDLGRFDDEGYLFLAGRIKEIINRAGEKISPREIDEVLLNHPGVAQAITFAMPDAQLGEEVAAAVVLHPGKSATERELIDFAAKQLADFKVPRRIVILDEIPKGPTGKPQRIGLAKMLGLDQPAAPAPAPEPAAPAEGELTAEQAVLAGIWGEVLECPVEQAGDHFLDLGGDSVLAAQVIARVRRQMGKELSMAEFFRFPKLAAMCAAIQKAPASAAAAPDGDAQTRRLPDQIESMTGEEARLAKQVRRGPASMGQKRLWLIEQVAVGSAAYHNAQGFRFYGILDPAKLRRCLSEIVRRHESLRMRFDPPAGDSTEPTVLIAPSLELEMPVEDLRGIPEDQRQSHAYRRAVEWGQLPFDLAKGPLVRVALLRLADEEHLLVYVVHHIISDRWSVGVMLGELAALYRLQEAAIPALGVSYSTCVAAEAVRMEKPEMAAHRDYWQTLLRERPSPLELPADHPRPAFPSYRGAVVRSMIDAPLAGALHHIARENGATPFMLYLAAFQTLLHRYTLEEDLVIGTPLAGRNQLETERLIGLFINILPLRTHAPGDKPFMQLLGEVKQAALDMLAHQDLSFDQLVDHLHVERDPSRHPVFDIVFNFHNVPLAPVWPPGLRVELEDIELGTSRFDLMLIMRPAGEEALSCQFEYSRDLFDPATIHRLVEHFQVLLAAIARDPKTPIGQLPLLAPSERTLILHHWSGADSSPGLPRQCVTQMIEQQAQARPDADAVISGSVRLTYGQLNQRANRLAWRLRRLGVGPDQLVAICLRRSEMLPVAILAVLKAGGAYVPLDPAYPRQRLDYMLEDSQARVLITQQELAELFAAKEQRTTVMIDAETAPPAVSAPGLQDDSTNPPPLAGLNHLAYVMYTSGSTGAPKGVAIERRSPAAFALWSAGVLGDDLVAGMLFSTSVCFDISLLELLVCLCRGGKLIVVQNVLEFPDSPAAREVTFINTVPSAMTELIGIGGVGTSVRGIALGGEAVPAALVRRCYELPNIKSVYNFYGPTEDTIYSTYWPVPRDMSAAPAIGRPFAGSRAYILDAHLEPVPIGVRGELYLGGPKLARGYLHQPQLTAQRFVPDPRQSGERLYRTGDLALWNADGTLHFLGRIDQQIKLRGFRIELGEIEAVLGSHPQVRQCAVVISGEESDRRLTAYVVAPAAPEIEELRRHLAAKLPAHMIPSAFVFLPAMPLTPNGKINRKALPKDAAPTRAPAGRPIAPTGPMQLQLAKIWREILHVPSVAANANFFELGGHSLGLVRVAARTRTELARELPLRGFFEHPTIAALAQWIEELSVAPAVRPIVRLSDDAVAPLSFGQQRLWFLDRFEPSLAVYNVASAQSLSGPLDADKLQAALRAVIGRHDSLRTIFPEVEGTPTERTLRPEQVSVELSRIDLSALPAEQRLPQARRHIAANTRQSFDLGKGPLLRACLIALGPDEHILSLCLHHIICDDWSMRLLYAQISQCYAGRTLEPPAFQYRDYAAWQRQWLEEGEMRRQIEFWVKQLAGAPALLALPTDRPRPHRQTFNGARLGVTLPPDLTRAIANLAAQNQTTHFVTLLAAFQLLLAQWTGQQDIVVGTPIANRDRPETQGLIGFFLNTLAFRMRLGQDANFVQLLQRVRAGVLDAFAHQDVPFERLIEELHVPRNLSHSPLVQVMFILLNEGAPTLDLPGIAARPLPGESVTAKFDLTLLLHESDEGMQGWLEYNTDLFDAPTLSALIDRWLHLLQTIVADPRANLAVGAAPAPVFQAALPAEDRPAPLADDQARLLAGGAGPSSARNGAPTQRALLSIWQDVLSRQPIGLDENFFDLGGHSLLAVRLLYRIRHQFGRTLPLATLFEASTIRQLAAMLDQPEDQLDQGDQVVVTLRSGNGRSPLFCLPGAGGFAITYHALTRCLPPGQPVYGLQFQGLPPHIKNHGTVEQMAAGLVDALRATQPHGPYSLAGYSFGGIVTFEMARQLEASGQRVKLLAIFDSYAPGKDRRRPLPQRLLVHGRRLMAMPPRQRREYARLLFTGLIHPVPMPASPSQSIEPLPDDSELLEQVQSLQQAAKSAFLAYDPEPWAGSLTLFRATVLSDWNDFLSDRPANGWIPLARGGVRIHDIPANHVRMMQDPAVALLGHKLDQCLR